MDILKKIIDHKSKEVAHRKVLFPVRQLELSVLFTRPTFSLKESLEKKEKNGIIAEFKRQSPSKGVINFNANVEQVTKGYISAGANALSVLTDKDFFGGSNADLISARSINDCPIVRKDFILDEYQIIESKSIGADVVLLIAAALDPKKLKSLTELAHSLDMEVLLEVHSLEEFQDNASSKADLIGVNNRNLKTFEVNIDISRLLSKYIPKEMVKISESGIGYPETIIELRSFGYQGFLMGESFMKHSKPEVAAKDFIDLL